MSESVRPGKGVAVRGWACLGPRDGRGPISPTLPGLTQPSPTTGSQPGPPHQGATLDGHVAPPIAAGLRPAEASPPDLPDCAEDGAGGRASARVSREAAGASRVPLTSPLVKEALLDRFPALSWRVAVPVQD